MCEKYLNIIEINNGIHKNTIKNLEKREPINYITDKLKLPRLQEKYYNKQLEYIKHYNTRKMHIHWFNQYGQIIKKENDKNI